MSALKEIAEWLRRVLALANFPFLIYKKGMINVIARKAL